jgi:fructose/tagatose bisphosphate aldolase
VTRCDSHSTRSLALHNADLPFDSLTQRVANALGLGERGRFLLAATFGNVHGVYQPGHVVLRPEVLKQIQDAVGRRHGRQDPFSLIFHGGSGSSLDDIREAIGYGVVKMNVDTDAQYAFTRPIADHVFKRYDGVVRVDGGTGDKAAYDPRSWGGPPRRQWPTGWSRHAATSGPQASVQFDMFDRRDVTRPAGPEST